MSIDSERSCTPAGDEPGKSPQVLPSSGQPQDHHQGRLRMSRPDFYLSTPDHICRDCIVGRASDFCPPFHFPMIVVSIIGHHSGTFPELIDWSWEVNPLPSRNTAGSHPARGCTRPTLSWSLPSQSLPFFFASFFLSVSPSPASVEELLDGSGS